MAHSHNKAQRFGRKEQPWFTARVAKDKKRNKAAKQARKRNRK